MPFGELEPFVVPEAWFRAASITLGTLDLVPAHDKRKSCQLASIAVKLRNLIFASKFKNMHTINVRAFVSLIDFVAILVFRKASRQRISRTRGRDFKTHVSSQHWPRLAHYQPRHPMGWGLGVSGVTWPNLHHMRP